MEWGPHVQRLLNIEEETGETPDSLEGRPDLRLATHAMLFQCFMTLHMMRTSNGFGPNPITLGMIREYLDLFGGVPIDMDLLVRIIKECDELALDWMRRKSETK